MAKIKIFVSAGHGINTNGKRSPDGSLREFQFNNPTAHKFKKIMEQYEDVEIIIVNDPTGKIDTPLAARTNQANSFYSRNIGDVKKGKVKVFYMSFHANAFGSGGWNTANGSETLIYSGANPEAVTLAKAIEAETGKLTGLKSRGIKYRPDLHELRESDMTALLHEAAFMTNKAENELLKSDSFREKVAQGVANAFVNYLGLKKKAAPPKTEIKAPTSDEKDNGLYYVQVGAFSSEENAEERKKQLEKDGYEAIIKYL